MEEFLHGIALFKEFAGLDRDTALSDETAIFLFR